MGCTSSKVVSSSPPAQPEVAADRSAGESSIRLFHSKMSLAHRKAALAALLSNAKAAQFFRSFLEVDFAESSLDFYDAVSALQGSGDAAPDALEKRANEVVERYVLPGAEREVNLPSHLRSACRTSPGQRLALLSQAREEILLLLAFDSYPRFLRSPAYTAMIAELSGGDAAHFASQYEIFASGSSHRYAPRSNPAVAGGGSLSDISTGSTASLEEPRSWLETFVRLADLLPGCITIAEVAAEERSETTESFPLVYVNAAFLRMTGYTWEEVQNRNCRFLQGPQTDPATIATLRQALAERRSVRVKILNYRKDGTPFHNLLAMKFVTEFATDEDAAANRNGVVRYVLGAQFEATADSMVDARLVELDTLVALLPSVYVAPRAAAGATDAPTQSVRLSRQRMSLTKKSPSSRMRGTARVTPEPPPVAAAEDAASRSTTGLAS